MRERVRDTDRQTDRQGHGGEKKARGTGEKENIVRIRRRSRVREKMIKQ